MKKYEEIIESGRIWNVNKFPLGHHGGFIKLPDCGTCTVVWRENEDGWEHVSVAPKKQFKIPSWDDMCILKDVFFYEEEEAYQIHPKKSEYVNIMENCLHLWKPIGHEINELVYEAAIKPIEESLEEKTFYKCKCGKVFCVTFKERNGFRQMMHGDRPKYCENCGKRLDWGKDHE